MTIRLGWFSTGRGEGSRGLLRMAVDAIRRGELDATIEFVFSNREPGEAEGSDRYLALAQEYGIPLATYSSRRFRREHGVKVSEDRAAYDREILSRLQGFHPDLCVLAGYMLIVGPVLCRTYPLVNVHPALPGGPKGTYQEVIWQLIEARAEETGIMVHLATDEVDEGPAITYVRFPIRGGAFDAGWAEVAGKPLERLRQEVGEELLLFRLIRQEQVRWERPLLLETLKAFARGELRAMTGPAITTGAGAPLPLCFNAKVEPSPSGPDLR